MRVGELTVMVNGRRVEVRRDGELVATARWDGARLSEREGSLSAARALHDRAEDRLWDKLALAIAEDERDALERATASAYDDQGVDLTLIDWMLAMTPAERLRVLERHAAGLAPFVLHDQDD